MARNHSCSTTKFLFVSALFSWVIFRSVSGRTISAARMAEEDDLCDLNKDHECEFECIVGDSTLGEFDHELFKLFINHQWKRKLVLKYCRKPGTACGDRTAEREGRPRVCRQNYYKHSDELITLGITSDEFRQSLPLDKLGSGCECVDPED